MMAEYTVIRDIDYYKESIELLYRITNNNSYENLKLDMLKRLEEREHAKVIEQLDKLSKIEEDIKREIDITHMDIQFYFRRFVTEDLCIAKILYQSMIHTVFQSDTKAIKNYIKQSFQNIKNDNTLQLSLENYEMAVSKFENNQVMPYTDRIGNLECEAAQKWQILDLIEHSDEHLDRLFPILEHTISKMKKFENILEELKKESCDYWEEYFKKNEFMKLINIFFNMKEDSFPTKPAYIRPQIMNYNKVLLYGNDENAGDYHILDVGITFDCEFRATKNTLTKEQLCTGLKMLSDPSKFEILRFIKDKRAYGQEIASELNLTTATISHHMNALITLGLINLEKVDNRIYYQTNKEAIYILLEEVKQTLF
ncbi:winged helix-turn-helix domain-containing protein [Lachnotalea glycerini]|jgi:DNA-binding transcriptional ArsR family regulator|nr:winged helix-turn-helix domain-containing protein [Lachnotalea glycerini]